MNKIAEMRQKRGELWDKAKAFLNEHTDENGMMSAEDAAAYERMEQDIDSFGAAIDRAERAEQLDRELNEPTSKLLTSRLEKNILSKPGRASDEYRDAFWKMVRNRSAHYTVYNALQEKGYNPINQIVGYILSEDPTYITNHYNARAMIRKLDRDELLQELVKSYLDLK